MQKLSCRCGGKANCLTLRIKQFAFPYLPNLFFSGPWDREFPFPTGPKHPQYGRHSCPFGELYIYRRGCLEEKQ
jgi:hypothetical protein